MKTLVAMLLSIAVVAALGVAFGERQFIATHLTRRDSARSYGTAVQDYNRYMPTIATFADGAPAHERGGAGRGIRGKVKPAVEQ